MTALILLSEFRKTEIELWLPIKEFPGYDISSLGRVRSYHRSGAAPLSRHPILLKERKSSYGYLIVDLCKNGRATQFQVHRLVAIAFIPNPEYLPQVNHLTAVKSDSRLGNLEWASVVSNGQHATEHGLRPRGTRHYRAKLSESDVLEIRKLRSQGLRSDRIAAKFGVAPSTVCAAGNGRNWKSLPTT